jgi:hypothetical protein
MCSQPDGVESGEVHNLHCWDKDIHTAGSEEVFIEAQQGLFLHAHVLHIAQHMPEQTCKAKLYTTQ